ncbi:DUF3883 domain-containing protein [bacterium]|nr:DUF3883 domain-containing protein [bacterium]
MANDDSISRKAVKFVLDYEMQQGRTVVDVQSNKQFRGFDVFSFSKDKKDIRTIEVKGTERKNGIPDCFETEFTREKRLIATYMYVVNFSNPQKIILYVIPASAFKPEYLKTTTHYKISSTFRTKILPKYRV